MCQKGNDSNDIASRDGVNNDDVIGDGVGLQGDENDVESTKTEDVQSNSGVNEKSMIKRSIKMKKASFFLLIGHHLLFFFVFFCDSAHSN